MNYFERIDAIQRNMSTLRPVRSGILLALLALLAVACGRTRNEVVPSEPLDIARLLALQDTLRMFAQNRDTSFCDSVLIHFDDVRLVGQRPNVVAHAYVSNVIARGAVRPELLERIGQLATRTGSAYLANWHTYLRGRMAMENNELDAATALFTEVHPRFMAAADTEGVSLVAKRLGLIFKERLNEPRKAVPYLRQYFCTAKDPVDRYLAAAHVCGAFILLDQPDSAAAERRFMDEHLDELERLAPGNSTFRGYRDIVRFDLVCRHALRPDAYALDSLRVLFAQLMAVMEPTYPQNHWNPVLLRVDMADALLANGRRSEAFSVLREGISIAEACSHCVLASIDLYDRLVELARAQGDHEAALKYLLAGNAWRERVNSDLNRSEVDKARKTMLLIHQRDSLALEKLSAQARSDLAIAEGKWQRNMIIFIAVLFLVSAGWLLNRSRLKRSIEVERMRARLSRDLHDDIGATLSSISILSNVAKKRAEASGDTDAASSMEKISERSQRIMREMSDIVWSVDPGKDSMTDLIGRMREFGHSVLEPKGIDFHFNAPTGAIDRDLPAEVKKNLYLIFKEAVNNAARHAEARNVFAELAVEGRSIRVQVDDDGRGFDPGTPRTGHGGNGLRNMQARAKEIGAVFSAAASDRGGVRVAVVAAHS